MLSYRHVISRCKSYIRPQDSSDTSLFLHKMILQNKPGKIPIYPKDWTPPSPTNLLHQPRKIIKMQIIQRCSSSFLKRLIKAQNALLLINKRQDNSRTYLSEIHQGKTHPLNFCKPQRLFPSQVWRSRSVSVFLYWKKKDPGGIKNAWANTGTFADVAHHMETNQDCLALGLSWFHQGGHTKPTWEEGDNERCGQWGRL